MKQALSFIAGVIVGVVGVTLYEIFGKAAEPSLEDTQPVRVKI